MTDDLRTLLEAQHAEHTRLKKAGEISPYVFRLVAEKRRAEAPEAYPRLCGLICSSYPPFTDDEEHASYVVLLWPIMAIPIDLNRVDQPKGVRYRTFDLIADNILGVENADRLTVGPLDLAGGTSQISLRIPSEPRDEERDRKGTIEGEEVIRQINSREIAE